MRSKVLWAGHMVRVDADKLVKRVEERGRKHQECKKRGNEQLIWKECLWWDTRRSGEDERWRGGGKYGKNQQKE